MTFNLKLFFKIVSRLRRRRTGIPVPPPGLDPERDRKKFGRDFVGLVARAAQLHRRKDTDVKTARRQFVKMALCQDDISSHQHNNISSQRTITDDFRLL